jgi:hypothetical protein
VNSPVAKQLPFERFMSSHVPVGALVEQVDEVLWEKSAIDPVIKERARIASAEALGCSY